MIKQIILNKTKEIIDIDLSNVVEFLPYRRKEKIKTLLINKSIYIAQRDKIVYICDRCGKKKIENFGYKQQYLEEKQYCKGCQIKHTKKELYGDENYVNTEKIKQTTLERHGYECALGNKEIKKQGMLNKYGVEHSMQLEECREKTQQTWLKKYGTNEILKINKLKKQGMLDKYGVENAFQSGKIQEKIKQILIKKYGREHYGGRCKMYEIDGQQVQGLFELKVANWLIENDIKFKAHHMKGIKYKDKYNKMRYYYPDFYLPDYCLYLEPHAKYFWDDKFEWKIQEVKKQINLFCFDEEYNIDQLKRVL